MSSCCSAAATVALDAALHLLEPVSIAPTIALGVRFQPANRGEYSTGADSLFSGPRSSIPAPLIHPPHGHAFDPAPSVALIEPPSFMMLKYAAQTPLVSLAAYVARGRSSGASFAGQLSGSRGPEAATVERYRAAQFSEPLGNRDSVAR